MFENTVVDSMEHVQEKPMRAPYQHQTFNHLFFDRIRAVQLEVEFMKAYLQKEESGRVGGAGLKREIAALDKISLLLFERVYRPIREKWM